MEHHLSPAAVCCDRQSWVHVPNILSRDCKSHDWQHNSTGEHLMHKKLARGNLHQHFCKHAACCMWDHTASLAAWHGPYADPPPGTTIHAQQTQVQYMMSCSREACSEGCALQKWENDLWEKKISWHSLACSTMRWQQDSRAKLIQCSCGLT